MSAAGKDWWVVTVYCSPLPERCLGNGPEPLRQGLEMLLTGELGPLGTSS